MSTRATIKFEDFYIYRHCDGYPEQVLPDIQLAIEKSKGLWSEPEVGMLVSFFLGIHFKSENRLPDYELTSGWHGDESYRYEVRFDKEWKTMIIKSASLNSDDPFGYKKEIERMAKPPHCSNCGSNDLEVFDSFDWKCKECGDIFTQDRKL